MAMTETQIKGAFERFYSVAVDAFVTQNGRSPTRVEEKHIRLVVQYAVAELIVFMEGE